jgi:zinc transport system ATP-binding protein
MLDEPTHSLDHAGAAAFYRLIDEVRRETGCGVVMASHDLHVVMRTSDRVICLECRIRCEGAPLEVAAAPAYRAMFGEPEGTLALDHHRHADAG